MRGIEGRRRPPLVDHSIPFFTLNSQPNHEEYTTDMKTITEIAAAFVIAGVTTAGLGGVYLANSEPLGTVLSTVQEPWVNESPIPWNTAPLEDEPGWDCRIHGNRTCRQPVLDPSTQPAPVPVPVQRGGNR